MRHIGIAALRDTGTGRDAVRELVELDHLGVVPDRHPEPLPRWPEQRHLQRALRLWIRLRLRRGSRLGLRQFVDGEGGARDGWVGRPPARPEEDGAGGRGGQPLTAGRQRHRADRGRGSAGRAVPGQLDRPVSVGRPHPQQAAAAADRDRRAVCSHRHRCDSAVRALQLVPQLRGRWRRRSASPVCLVSRCHLLLGAPKAPCGVAPCSVREGRCRLEWRHACVCRAAELPKGGVTGCVHH